MDKFLRWIQAWTGLFGAAVRIVTYTYYAPRWEMDFARYRAHRAINNLKKRSNTP